MSDLNYIDNLWSLDNTKNAAYGDLETLKKQFAYKIWKEDYSHLQKREDSKKNEFKGVVSEAYQLIGFYSVFQGVWFQGVAQLASETSCRASVLPVIISVLVSIATIIGIHLKLTRAFTLKKSFSKDKLSSKILESRIFQFEINGLKVNLGTPDANPKQTQKIVFEKELEKLHQTTLAFLAFLTTLSVLFAWLVYAMMCNNFP